MWGEHPLRVIQEEGIQSIRVGLPSEEEVEGCGTKWKGMEESGRIMENLWIFFGKVWVGNYSLTSGEPCPRGDREME